MKVGSALRSEEKEGNRNNHSFKKFSCEGKEGGKLVERHYIERDIYYLIMFIG